VIWESWCCLLLVGCLLWTIILRPATASPIANADTSQATQRPTPGFPNHSEDPKRQTPEHPTPDLPIYLIRRVILLNLPGPQSDNLRVQERIKTERVRNEQRRQRRRKRLFAPGPAVKPPRKLPLPPAVFTQKRPQKPKEPDAVPMNQRVAIAQALLADALSDRLQDLLKITTVPDAEVQSALRELHLSLEDATHSDGAQRLCTRLQAQAVLAPQITGVDMRDGVTRDSVIHVVIHIPGTQIMLAPAQAHAVKPPAAYVVPHEVLPTQLMVAGAAQVPRVMFGSQYTQSQTTAIRLAAQQVAALTVHALFTGRSAPFMQPGERLAIAPVMAPTVADKLLFTPQGRRLIPNRVRDLPPDYSALFLPSLLPLLPEDVLTPNQILARTNLAPDEHNNTVNLQEREQAIDVLGRSLWVNDDTPNIGQAQNLAKRLGVNYILMAHVTDIEIEEGPPLSEAPAIAPISNASHSRNRGRNAKSPRDREREAKVEVVGALLRAADGDVLWHAHASATMSVMLPGGEDPKSWPTDRRIAADAARFALSDLERQLAQYRASYEK
jgi:hypothetical protein